MADLTTSRCKVAAPQLRTRMAVTLASGQTVYQNNLAAIDLSTGKVVNGTGSNANLRVIGTFERDTAATADTSVVVALSRPVTAEYFDNDTVAPVTAAKLGQVVYVKDNHTVTLTATANATAGICWGVSATDGVLVEVLPPAPNAPPAVLSTVTAAAWTSNDWSPSGASLVSGTVYTLPATAAASTVTLPVTGLSAGTGIALAYPGGGTAGNTVTVQESPTTALTTALAGNKRNQIRCIWDGAVWTANAYTNAS